MALVTCGLVWLKQLLTDSQFEEARPIILIYDNRIALHIVSNPIFHEMAKRIEIGYHFIRERRSNQATLSTLRSISRYIC